MYPNDFHDLSNYVRFACVRDSNGKPTAMRNEWRGLEVYSPTLAQLGARPDNCKILFQQTNLIHIILLYSYKL